MPAVYVHGVPETPLVWDALISHLNRDDAVALQLPGFGSPRPEGFGATKEEYVDWLVGELERLASVGPVDLVGHDWGGGLVIRVVSTRPELVRTWVSDAAGIGDVDLEWHALAKIWQTAGDGEAFFEQQLAEPVDARAKVLEILGVPPADALAMAGWLDETMAGCILALYRSAVDVGKEWGPQFRDIASPGLVVLPSEDPFLAVDRARASAAHAGAETIELDGLSHWWMLQDPERGARIIEDFWATIT